MAKALLILILILISNAGFTLVADPTQPLDWQKQVMQQKIDNQDPAAVRQGNIVPVLSAVFKFGQNRKLAIINDQVVKEGDIVFGYKILEIGTKQVIIRSEQTNETLTLALFKQLLTNQDFEDKTLNK